VLAGQRIGILGANGQGKSTLVKTIARELKGLGGFVREGKGLNIGYFAQQELDVLRPHETPLQHLVRVAKESSPTGQADREQDLRSFLGTFNFGGDMVKQAVGTMSGGEKARLVLCMIVWQRPNLLLLDEPTNHLDLTTREALSMALNEFEGTVMLVSHDRSLLRSVCDEFWLVTRGGVENFAGDLDDYQRYLLEEARRNRESLRELQKNAKTPPRRPPSGGETERKSAGNLKALQRDQGQVEKQLLDLQTEQHSLEARLSTPLPAPELADVGRRLQRIAEELTEREEIWLGLADRIDALARQATP
jgi:ATP-binding cassette subfamily F protein 3